MNGGGWGKREVSGKRDGDGKKREDKSTHLATSVGGGGGERET